MESNLTIYDEDIHKAITYFNKYFDLVYFDFKDYEAVVGQIIYEKKQ